jgi:hypothetical protein
MSDYLSVPVDDLKVVEFFWAESVYGHWDYLIAAILFGALVAPQVFKGLRMYH